MTGLYIHIPFCKQKCHYCNFYSLASTRYKDDLINAIVNEVMLQQHYLENELVDTIYLGGGTPTLLSADELNRLFDSLAKSFKLAPDPEITLEANPDDISSIYYQQIRKTPVNRISLGVQSFRDADLKYLNRIHSARQAENAIKLLQDAGMTNLTIDLIYGIPTLTDEDWAENLESFFSFDLPHLSAYALTVEPNTALDVLIRKGKKTDPEDGRMAAQFIQLLEAMVARGYLHYETSNFCKANAWARHNTNYWRGGKYLGLGPSAHSYNGLSRQWNVANIKEYIEGINNHRPVFEKEILTRDQKYNEYVMVSLRTMWGVDIELISEQFGENYTEHFLKEVQRFEKLKQVKRSRSTFVLTKIGKLLADGIAAQLFRSADDG